MVEKVLSSVKKEADRQYFFSKLNNPLWLEPLRERGYFSNPPGVKKLPDGFVQYPHWPELVYLETIAGEAADQIIDIVLALPKTENPRVYYDILSIALKLQGQESARLLPKLIEYTELENQFLANRYPDLLQHWSTQKNFAEALEIVKRLIPFREDQRAQEKQQLRKGNPDAWNTFLEPTIRFNQWEYQRILEKGVRPLAEHKPYQVACILIDTVASMIKMSKHRNELDKGGNEDLSEIWCRRLDKPGRNYQDNKEILVHTLTYTCEQVYDKAPKSIDVLDQALRNQRWKVFKRLRQHLYALYPNEQTLPWIRELILEHRDYSKWEYHYEFQLMIRKVCEYFGACLLSESERSTIFDAILSGPSKEDFREWMGERYSDVAFEQRKRYFHRMQLRPFAALLSGDVRCYFDELEGKAEAEDINDDSYSPYGEMRTGRVTHQSPKSSEELESFTDEELLNYLNEWDDEHHGKGGDTLVKITMSALADLFQCLFRDRIVPDTKRLAFWMEQRERIARPIYVAAMVKAMQEMVKKKSLGNLDQWNKFCLWVLLRLDSKRINGQSEPSEGSRDYPDWGSSRRAVVDFIDACVEKNTDAPLTAREGLAKLLQLVCCQFDWQLDHEQPVLPNRDDPISEAINNTRSRALESLVNFGFWIRRHLPEDSVPEATDILSKRMAKDAEIPLTRPEQALLGMLFGNLCALNRKWAIANRKTLFPQENLPIWRDAFGIYIAFNRPVKATFEILRGEFEFALENLNVLTAKEDDIKNLVGMLGQHLFLYYLWEVYPLTGDESLLERFYNKTSDDRKRWARLFEDVGRLLRNSDKHLDKVLTNRAIAYFDWRFQAAEPLELQEFTFCLEAECLDPEWRLSAYSKILKLSHGRDIGFSIVMRALTKLLPDHLALVVECFAKITDAMDQSTHLYVSADEAKPILKAGLLAENPQVRKNAELARENLLRFGRFDFMNME